MNTSETKLVNIFKNKYDVYIGRPGKGQNGYFGNPFPLPKGALKGSTLPKYREYFVKRLQEDQEFKEKILSLKGKTLGCFCASPDTCHGSIIVEYINNYYEQL